MNYEDDIRFAILEEKLSQLIDSHKQLKLENQELQSLLSAANDELVKAKQKYSELYGSYCNMKAGRVLEGLDLNDVGVTRERLAKLVREVDHCIALLNA